MENGIKIYFTSDTHGHVFPSDYAAHKRKASGLLNLAAQLEKDGDTLVLDGGDSLQGTPLLRYYLEHTEEFPLHPVATAFNVMGCDYFTLGNHDFNFGYDTLYRYVSAMNAVCLCANVRDKTGKLPIIPWTVRTMANGLRIGLTGIVTDYVTVWENLENIANLQISDAYTAAEQALAALRPQCDLCVCIYHGGFEEDLNSGRSLSQGMENLACKLARELSYDVLLTGHQHMAVPGVTLGKTFAVQPPANAQQYIAMRCTRNSSKWAFDSELCPVGSATALEPYEALLSLEEATQQRLDKPVGQLAQPIPAKDKLSSALYGDALADLFNQVQMDATGADISCTSLGNDPVGLNACVTLRDLAVACPFANTLVVLEVTEPVLRTLLERCAAYFTMQEGKPAISSTFLEPKIEHYNYDFYSGIAYTFDLRRPIGNRVVRLRMLDGSPITGSLRLCTTNYRATGTGGYEALTKCPVISSGIREMPDLLDEYIQRQSCVELRSISDMKVVWTD